MSYDEFFALDPGLLRPPLETGRQHHRQAAPATDASAFQERLSAQVALLQSPILPAAQPPYRQQIEFSNIPVDDTHTSPIVSEGFGCRRSPAVPRPKRETWVSGDGIEGVRGAYSAATG